MTDQRTYYLPTEGLHATGLLFLIVVGMLIVRDILQFMIVDEIFAYAIEIAAGGTEINPEILKEKFGRQLGISRAGLILMLSFWVLFAFWAYSARKNIHYIQKGITEKDRESGTEFLLLVPFVGQFYSLLLMIDIWQNSIREKYMNTNGMPAPNKFPLLVVIWWVLYISYFLSNRFGMRIAKAMDPSMAKFVFGGIILFLNTVAHFFHLVLIAVIIIVVWRRLSVLGPLKVQMEQDRLVESSSDEEEI